MKVDAMRIARAVVGFFVVAAALLVLVVEVAMLVGEWSDIEERREKIPEKRAALQKAERKRQAIYDEHPELEDLDEAAETGARCAEDLKSLREDYPEATARARRKREEPGEQPEASEAQSQDDEGTTDTD